MPHLRFRKMDPTVVQTLSKTLLVSLSNLIECPAEWITFEQIHSTSYYHGEVCQGEPYIEVFWFERALEIQDKVAKKITEEVKKIVDSTEVTVVFAPLSKRHYYENGEHF